MASSIKNVIFVYETGKVVEHPDDGEEFYQKFWTRFIEQERKEGKLKIEEPNPGRFVVTFPYGYGWKD